MDYQTFYEIYNPCAKVAAQFIKEDFSRFDDIDGIVELSKEALLEIRKIENLDKKIIGKIIDSIITLDKPKNIYPDQGMTFNEIVCNSLDEILYFINNGSSGYNYDMLLDFEFFKKSNLDESMKLLVENQYEETINHIVCTYVKKLDFNTPNAVKYVNDCQRYNQRRFNHDKGGDYGLRLPIIADVPMWGDGGHDEYCIFKYNDELYILTMLSGD